MSTLIQNDRDSIKADIDNYFGKDISPEDRGAAYVQFGHMYMRVSNSINRAYLNALNIAIGLLKSVNSAESKANDAIDQAEVRHRIQTLAA